MSRAEPREGDYKGVDNTCGTAVQPFCDPQLGTPCIIGLAMKQVILLVMSCHPLLFLLLEN